MKSFGKLVFGDTRRVIRNGNWYGNDTIWRMILDLNKILLYANTDGSLRSEQPQARKAYISIVDAIISGEGNGPEAPDPRHVGLLVGGVCPVAVDAVCARFMGFDWKKIPSIRCGFSIDRYPLCEFDYSDIVIDSSIPNLRTKLIDLHPDDRPFGRISAGKTTSSCVRTELVRISLEIMAAI
jgi:Domain of unknown function (DUF362)